MRVTGAGKTGAAAKVAGAIQDIPALSMDEIAALLPLPSPESWKFAAALPQPDFQTMVLTDYYHIGVFTRTLAQVPVILDAGCRAGRDKDRYRGVKDSDRAGEPKQILSRISFKKSLALHILID